MNDWFGAAVFPSEAQDGAQNTASAECTGLNRLNCQICGEKQYLFSIHLFI